MDQELIKKYLRGECTPQERERVKALMRSGKARSLFDEALNEHWTDETTDTDTHQMAGWKAKFYQRVHAQEEKIVPLSRNYQWLKYAAVWAVLVLGIGGYAFLKFNNQQTAVIALQQTINPNGKLLKIKLSDNSVITLNAASKLTYPASFNGKTREVYLDGEAFFDVTHDTEHPFVVHTSKVKVSVLGTSFDVRSYRDDQKIAVAVATGKVGVLANEKSSKVFMLLPGDKLAYNEIGKAPQLSTIDLNEIGSWRSGMLIYHNETLANIAKQLERWYNIKIIFKKEGLGQTRYNLKQKNDRLENVMKTLQFAGGITYKISGKTVTIW